MRNKKNIFYSKIHWNVVKWNQVWKSIGFPTANLKLKSDISIETWTYRINWIIDDKVYMWAWVFLWNNIFEAHFIDYKWNLYGKKISIIIFYKIRENVKFDDIDSLKKEIEKDLNYIKNNQDYVLSFWTFDKLHLWHKFYLEQAKRYWDKLVTIVAKSKNVEKFKWKKPKLSEKDRLEAIRKSNISDIVHIWDTNNPLKWLDLYDPKIICLWYDQESFVEKLKNYIKEKKLNIKVVRIPPYKQWKFKSSILNKKEN